MGAVKILKGNEKVKRGGHKAVVRVKGPISLESLNKLIELNYIVLIVGGK